MEVKRVKITVKNYSGNERIKIALIQGEVDFATAPEVAAALASLFAAENTIILDFSDLEYMSTTGLTLLTQLNSQAEKKNISLKIASVSDFVRQILEYSGVIKLLNVYKTVQEAAESINSKK